MAISGNARQRARLIAQIRRRKNRANTLFAGSSFKRFGEVSARDAPQVGGDFLGQSVASLPLAETERRLLFPDRANRAHVLDRSLDGPWPRLPLILAALAGRLRCV